MPSSALWNELRKIIQFFIIIRVSSVTTSRRCRRPKGKKQEKTYERLKSGRNKIIINKCFYSTSYLWYMKWTITLFNIMKHSFSYSSPGFAACVVIIIRAFFCLVRREGTNFLSSISWRLLSSRRLCKWILVQTREGISAKRSACLSTRDLIM